MSNLTHLFVSDRLCPLHPSVPPSNPPSLWISCDLLSLFSQIRIREQEGRGGGCQQKARAEGGRERKLKQYGKEIRKVGGLGCLGNCKLPCAWVGVLMTPPNYGKIRQAKGNWAVGKRRRGAWELGNVEVEIVRSEWKK